MLPEERQGAKTALHVANIKITSLAYLAQQLLLNSKLQLLGVVSSQMSSASPFHTSSHLKIMLTSPCSLQIPEDFSLDEINV